MTHALALWGNHVGTRRGSGTYLPDSLGDSPIANTPARYTRAQVRRLHPSVEAVGPVHLHWSRHQQHGGCTLDRTEPLQHGALRWRVCLTTCVVTGSPRTVYGYMSMLLRDNIHNADLVSAFYQFYCAPGRGRGLQFGSHFSNCSMTEAIARARKTPGGTPLELHGEQSHRRPHLVY